MTLVKPMRQEVPHFEPTSLIRASGGNHPGKARYPMEDESMTLEEDAPSMEK